MAENPRELIRAAQSAEMQGDVARAVECLQKAAALYRDAGKTPRALQLLRHALRLDGRRGDIAEEVNRLEWLPETLLARPPVEDDEDAPLERSLDAEPLPEGVQRQRLIEDALREAALHASDEAPRDSAQAWVIEREVVEDLQRLDAQLAQAAEAADTIEAPEEARPRRRREVRLIERGPTRADAALDAWCSFCCRPHADTGDLVAGPAGAFICKSCLLESQSLLEDVAPAPPTPVSRAPLAAESVVGLVGQGAVRDLLMQSLQAQTRCLLVVGPEGTGKSTWFQQLQREGHGVITSLADLDGASAARALLVEDVERLSAEAHATLQSFLARHRRPTVVLSARGHVREHQGLALRGDARTVLLPTTASLSQAVRGAVPTGLLEHVQVLLPLRVPTQSEFVEIARARLASREPAVSLSEDVLAALATEAGRSPRAGHELHALLNRVPTGTWHLEPAAKPAAPRKARRKRTP